MQSDKFDDLMRRFEWFHSLRVPQGCYAVLRLDGRSFSKVTENFQKPFDPLFNMNMRLIAETLMTEFDASYGFTESDEISILLNKDFDIFDRELEKLVSISAALAASKFTLLRDIETVAFDSRISVLPGLDNVIDYFRCRSADALRCGLNSWAYWTLRKEGMTAAQATLVLSGKDKEYKNELLFQNGINFNDVPAWQKRGVGLRWEEYDKEGEDPRTGQKATARRRRLAVDDSLPEGDAYSKYIRDIVLADEARRKK